ncbi:MAG TPA: hypothetical protein VK589_18505 [Chryseolinea sp.]|nr:hypothetical protein [Chryseolinea sp.]
MQTKPNIFLSVLLGVVVVCSMRNSSSAQSAKDSVWIQSLDGCKVYNPHPVKNETITWSGNCVGSYATGTGTLQWYKNGKQNQQYVGEVKRGSPHGKGRYLFEDGTVHEGTYVNGDLYGAGAIIRKYKSNTVSYTYSGDLKEDLPSGRGQEIEFAENGDTLRICTGEFLEGEIHGEGTMKKFDDDFVTISKGKFKQGRVYGRAEIWWYYKRKLIDYYNGEYDYGRNGYGELVSGHNRYAGEWRRHRREGKGKIYMDSILVYDGEWYGDKFHGSGKRYFFDGSTYFGEFKDNRRHGIGTQYWNDGTRYIGEFSGDLYSGYGYFVKEGKVIACGNWQNGRLKFQEDFTRIKNLLVARHKTKLAQFGINLI